MLPLFLGQPSPSGSLPVARPRFQPSLHSLDDRITPTLSFASFSQSFAADTFSRAVAVGDFNQDGVLDVAVVNQDVSNVSVLLNSTPSGNSTASFFSQRTFAVGTQPYAVAVADFNGDGRSDLAVSCASTGTISVLLNTTAFAASIPTFSGQTSFAAGANPGALATGDFNGDGRADIAYVNNAGSSILINAAPVGSTFPAFQASQVVSTGNLRTSIAVADFNKDGRLDLATVYSTYAEVNLNATALGSNTINFVYKDYNQGVSNQRVGVGDFNGDGLPDMVLSVDGSTTVRVILSIPTDATSPAFGSASGFTLAGGASSAPLTADFDGDGRTDIAVGTSGGGISVVANTTVPMSLAATFASALTTSVGSSTPFTLAAADFNGDGRTDLAVDGMNVAVVKLNTSTNPAVTGPALVGQFATGLARYNKLTGSWDLLTSASADKLAVAPSGNAVANFGGYGVYYYRASTGIWSQINGNAATAVAIDGLGNAYASFAGYGTYRYRLTTSAWEYTTGAVANKLAADANGNLVANFAGFGVYRYTITGNWYLINGVDAVALASGANGEIAASFAGYGTYEYLATTGWKQINGVTASALAVDGSGNVTAVFTGYGVARYIAYANGWASLTLNGAATAVAVDQFGNVFASFSGNGVWEFNAASGWHQRRTGDASALGVGR